MDIQKVKEQRVQLEARIKTLVTEFEAETQTELWNMGLIRHSAVDGMGKVVASEIEIFVTVEVPK